MILTKQTIFSGMQPSGKPHLGNYLGAIKNWASLQDEYNCIYCIVDLHSLTVRQNSAELRQNARNLLTLYIAAGLDAEKNIVYYQSHVPGHAQLAWILNCYTYMGELNRMTQFKEKSSKHAENINAGLFTYPVLMAADILLYQAGLVPVGDDQKQHLEICRDIAVRFNNIYGDTFTVPEAYIGKAGARIMSLQEPEKKMSKSDAGTENDLIYLLDEPKAVISKIKKAVTDSENQVRFAPEKPGIANLINIYCAVTKKTVPETEKEFENSGYGAFKTAVGECVAAELEPVRRRYEELTKDKAYIDSVIKNNAARANELAERTLKKVSKKVGLPLEI
ncbi:MAG: tryptophan--tRNA ligase [Clostridiales bacterium]|nr:tryptophan--tRNA ligase [Clostridiales bacterium]